MSSSSFQSIQETGQRMVDILYFHGMNVSYQIGPGNTLFVVEKTGAYIPDRIYAHTCTEVDEKTHEEIRIWEPVVVSFRSIHERSIGIRRRLKFLPA